MHIKAGRFNQGLWLEANVPDLCGEGLGDGGAVELDDDGIILPGAGNPWRDFEVLNGELDLNQVRSRVAGAVDAVFVPPTPPEEPQDVVVTVPVETTEGSS